MQEVGIKSADKIMEVIQTKVEQDRLAKAEQQRLARANPYKLFSTMRTEKEIRIDIKESEREKLLPQLVIDIVAN